MRHSSFYGRLRVSLFLFKVVLLRVKLGLACVLTRRFSRAWWWPKLASQSFHFVSFHSIIIQKKLAPQIFWLFFLPGALVSRYILRRFLVPVQHL